MTAKPNRILLRFLRPPIRPNAAEPMVRQQPRAIAASAQSFVTGVGPTLTFMAPQAGVNSEIPPGRDEPAAPPGAVRFQRRDRAAPTRTIRIAPAHNLAETSANPLSGPDPDDLPPRQVEASVNQC
jgi:hypothetical protein